MFRVVKAVLLSSKMNIHEENTTCPVLSYLLQLLEMQPAQRLLFSSCPCFLWYVNCLNHTPFVLQWTCPLAGCGAGE